MDFLFYTSNPTVYRGLRHMKFAGNLYDRFFFHPQIKHGQFLSRKIALFPEAFALRFGKLGLDVQRRSPLTLTLDPCTLSAPLPASMHYYLRH